MRRAQSEAVAGGLALGLCGGKVRTGNTHLHLGTGWCETGRTVRLLGKQYASSACRTGRPLWPTLEGYVQGAHMGGSFCGGTSARGGSGASTLARLLQMVGAVLSTRIRGAHISCRSSYTRHVGHACPREATHASASIRHVPTGAATVYRNSAPLVAETNLHDGVHVCGASAEDAL